MTICLSVSLFVIFAKEALFQSFIQLPLNFQSDLDHHLDTKKIQIFHLCMCFGGGMYSSSTLVFLTEV